MNTRLVALFIFLIFLCSGYVTMGYARHNMCDEMIEEHIANWVSAKEKGIEKPIGWEDHEYLGTPEAALVIADPVFRNEMYSLYDILQEYSTEYETEVVTSILGEIDDHGWSLWDAYKRITLFQRVRTTIYLTFFPIYLGPDNSDDWGGSLAESVVLWESAGGKREGDWMEAFRQSPEYEAWLGATFAEISEPKELSPPRQPLSAEDRKELLDEIDKKISEALSQGKNKDDPEVQSLLLAKKMMEVEDSDNEEEDLTIYEIYEPMSTEERYSAAKRSLELSFSGRILCTDIVGVHLRMVEIAYGRYTTHASEKDIVRAGIDAYLVEYAGHFLVSAEKLDLNTYDFLRGVGFPFKALLIDMCIIIGFSILSTLFVVRVILPHVEARRRKKNMQ